MEQITEDLKKSHITDVSNSAMGSIKVEKSIAF
jgi:hypothetical protein